MTITREEMFDNAFNSVYGIDTEDALLTEDFGTFQNFAEGAIVETGNVFDLAIKGDAFFCLETKAGEMYTRKGQFSLNSDGMLVSNEGDIVLSENNEPPLVVIIAPHLHSI